MLKSSLTLICKNHQACIGHFVTAINGMYLTGDFTADWNEAF